MRGKQELEQKARMLADILEALQQEEAARAAAAAEARSLHAALDQAQVALCSLPSPCLPGSTPLLDAPTYSTNIHQSTSWLRAFRSSFESFPSTVHLCDAG